MCLWKATCGSAGEVVGRRAKIIRVERLTNMHVGGCQVRIIESAHKISVAIPYPSAC